MKFFYPRKQAVSKKKPDRIAPSLPQYPITTGLFLVSVVGRPVENTCPGCGTRTQSIRLVGAFLIKYGRMVHLRRQDMIKIEEGRRKRDRRR